MDKIAEALGPWPILQMFFGMTVLGVGVFALIRGLNASKTGERMSLDDARQEWEAYQHLEQIVHYTQAISENQKLMLDRINYAAKAVERNTEAINNLASVLWNRSA